MSAIFDFSSLVTAILLLIVTCTYLRGFRKTIFDNAPSPDGVIRHEGIMGLCWKFSRIGERKSIIRGAYVGAIWGGFFHRYGDLAKNELSPATAPSPSAIGLNIVRTRVVGACKHAALLSTFLGLYSGSSCVAEKLVGKRGGVSAFIGGFTAGSFAGFTTNMRGNALTWGLGTGLASVIVYGLQSQ